jgi:hypothetical protein
MREEVIDYLQSQNLGSFTIASEVPWTETGTVLYLKNLKKIYVDVDAFTTDPLITTFTGLNITNETTAVRVYFANDAKQLPSNYDEVVSAIKAAKDINTTAGYARREVNVSTSYDNDRLITEIELRYIKLT